MRFLSFMSNTSDMPGVEGLIDECGLRPAYNRIFTEDERRHIESRQGNFPLTKGAYIASHLGEFDMVADLLQFAERFAGSPPEVYIGMRFHIMATSFLELTGDWFSYHQVMQLFIPRVFSLRASSPRCDPLTQEACEQHIRHTQQIVAVMENGQPQGPHAGYWHMSLLMDERKKLDSALYYARQGKAQGWEGEWGTRIAGLEKRIPPKETPMANPLEARLGPPKAAAPRVVSCVQCGQRMRIPADYQKPQGTCIKCGAVVLLAVQGI
ncbi:MAG: hypothetical protein HYV27_06110 [Candidatus Hydrogenedentes bacterium]|nr:hypothetical protein [Candidatus Hydrogenedentota bacterium]